MRGRKALSSQLSAFSSDRCEVFPSAYGPMGDEGIGSKGSKKDTLVISPSPPLPLSLSLFSPPLPSSPSPLASKGLGVKKSGGCNSKFKIQNLKLLTSPLFLAFFWLFLFSSAGILEAGEASLEIRVPDHAVTVGDRVSIRVQARGGEDALWGALALSSAEGDPWAVVEGPREISGAKPPAWEVVLVPLDIGDLELPAIEASLRNTDGVAINIAADQKSTITVASVLAPEDEGQPAPLRDPLGAEGFPWEWAAPLFVVVLPLVLLAAWWWRSRSRGTHETGEAPRLAPFDELERLLREVQAAIGLQPAAVVCDRLASGVRYYLERRTGEPAVEMTSNELRILARRAGWSQEVQLGLQRLTGVADGVRFGRQEVADSELEAAGQSAHEIGKELEIFLKPDDVDDEGEQ